MDRLNRAFFDRDTLAVARGLLGQRLVRVLDGERLSRRIVEEIGRALRHVRRRSCEQGRCACHRPVLARSCYRTYN